MTTQRIFRSFLLATVVTAGGLVAPSAASAGPPPINPGVSAIPRPSQVCLSTIKVPSFCKTDLSIDFDPISPTRTTFAGQPADFICLHIRNRSALNAGRLFTSIGNTQGDILGVTAIGGNRNVRISRASDGATTTAPLAVAYVDDAWIVEHPAGLRAGEQTSVCLYVTAGRMDVIAEANSHVGVDYLGTPGLSGYRLAEATRSNNRADYAWR